MTPFVAGEDSPRVQRRRQTAYPPPSPIWRDDVVFTCGLSSFGDAHREAALAEGFDVLAVLLDGDPSAPTNREELRRIRARLTARDFSLVGWAPTYRAEQASLAATYVREFELAGWITNLEAWAEGANRDLTGDWFRAWENTGTPAPVAVSMLSSDTGSSLRDFDHRAALASGATLMPQVYGNEHPTYTVAAARAQLRLAAVPDEYVNLTFGVYGDDVPFADYRTWSGPRGVYLGERLDPTEWKELRRT